MFKKILLFSTLVCVSSVVSAGGLSDTATVTSIGSGTFYNERCGFNCVVVNVVPAPTGSTPCDYSGGWKFAIDLDSPEGATQVSTILSAQATGKKIGIAGNGICTASLGMEKVYYIFTHP
jgi:hypothetical protein